MSAVHTTSSQAGRHVAVGIWRLGVVAAACALLAVSVVAQDMPDPSVIHGRALPAPELTAGTVTVRVMREAMGNNVPGQQVRLIVGAETRTATTDELGRAEFSGLPPGQQARAETTVDGEAMTSQAFDVPASGGVRVALISGIERAAERRRQEEAAAAAAPPTKGTVVLGGDSRIVLEFSNDSLFAFYILEIVNNARTRVDIGGPLIIDLPESIAGAALTGNSSPTASINGSRITVQGPFASGVTPVQVQFAVRYGSPERVFEQIFPVPLQRVVVGLEKVNDVQMASMQFASVNELPTENGPYLLGQGGALAAGAPLTVTFSNLPLHSRAPRWIALGLALAIAIVGAWLAFSVRGTRARERDALMARRDTLLGELAQLEAKRRDGAIPPEKYQARRQRIVAELERIYGELDDASVGPQGGGEGIAA